MHPTKEKRRRNYTAGGTNKSLGLKVCFHMVSCSSHVVTNMIVIGGLHGR